MLQELVHSMKLDRERPATRRERPSLDRISIH